MNIWVEGKRFEVNSYKELWSALTYAEMRMRICKPVLINFSTSQASYPERAYKHSHLFAIANRINFKIGEDNSELDKKGKIVNWRD